MLVLMRDWLWIESARLIIERSRIWGGLAGRGRSAVGVSAQTPTANKADYGSGVGPNPRRRLSATSRSCESWQLNSFSGFRRWKNAKKCTREVSFRTAGKTANCTNRRRRCRDYFMNFAVNILLGFNFRNRGPRSVVTICEQAYQGK